MKKPKIEITEKVSFKFTHLRNAERVAIALSTAGYYVKIVSNSIEHIVYIYTDR